MIDISQNAYVSNGEYVRDLFRVPDPTADMLVQLLTPHVATVVIQDVVESGNGGWDVVLRHPLSGRLYSVSIQEVTDTVSP